MKKTLYVLGGLAVVALLAAVPVHAASVAISDADLAGISGKAAAATSLTTSTAAFASLDEGNGNSQTGDYSWSDGHTADASDHKGANDVGGANSVVQQNITGQSNVISWGAWSSGSGIVGTAADLNQSGVSSATQHIGGF